VPACDFLDASGVGRHRHDDSPTAVYIRRWTIIPLPRANNTLILQVMVTTVMNERTRGDGVRSRMLGDSLLISVKTRKAP
jgi:hypothetical protein